MQAEILQLLGTLAGRGLGWLFISHDLQAVASVCTRILFLHQGRIVEDLAVENLARARSDCARELIGAVMALQGTDPANIQETF